MSRSTLTAYRSRNCGFAYLEALIATVLVAVALVPALEALSPALQGSAVHSSEAALHFHGATRLEEVMAEPFAALDMEAQAIGDPTVASDVYSDASAATDRRLVFLSRYDGDNADGDGDPFTGMDEGLVWIRVTVPATRLDLQRLTSVQD